METELDQFEVLTLLHAYVASDVMSVIGTQSI